MKTSVAMCTYNGAKYIREQLDSILNQSHPVDEIVICDDGSIDATIDIIKQVIDTTSTSIKLYKNKENLGFFKNFLQAISLCTGDIIFLSDQDDLWRDDKVEKICDWFNTYEKKDVVFTDAKLIDEYDYEFTKDTLWKGGFGKRMQRYFDNGYGLEIFAITNRATGATMAFRKSFIEGKELSAYNLPLHDYIIVLLAVSENKCGYIKETLTSYRIHKGQTIGVTEGYPPSLYPPLRAYTQEVDDVQCLPDNAARRLNFMCKRGARYRRKLGWSGVVFDILNYVRYYGVWWYRFMGYDIYQCVRYDFLCLGKALLKPFKWFKRK